MPPAVKMMCNSYELMWWLYTLQEILKLSSNSYSGSWMSQIVICGGPALWSTIPHHFPIFTWLITQLIVATLNAWITSISPFLYQISFMLASSPLVLHIWTRAMIARTSSLILMIGLAGSVILMYAWIWPYPTKCLSCACWPALFSNYVQTHRSRSHRGLWSHGPGRTPGPHSQAEISPCVNLHIRVLIVSGATSGIWLIPLEHWSFSDSMQYSHIKHFTYTCYVLLPS